MSIRNVRFSSGDGRRSLREGSEMWMTYITGEVRATCEAKNWGHQIRRKWAVREQPVSDSLVDDYEWKLIPSERSELPEHPPHDFDEGVYFVLGFDPRRAKFVLQHDTHHCGREGLHRQRVSFTEISFAHVLSDTSSGPTVVWYPVGEPGFDARVMEAPKRDWLREHLMELTTRFGPNHLSLT